MGETLPLRRVVARDELQLRPYDRYGRVVEGLFWHPVTDDPATGEATFFLRFAPGASSTPHEHMATEEFLMLEGELVDPDGQVFKPGDFVSYRPGSRHSSRSPGGCLLLVFLRKLNRRLEAGEEQTRVG